MMINLIIIHVFPGIIFRFKVKFLDNCWICEHGFAQISLSVIRSTELFRALLSVTFALLHVALLLVLERSQERAIHGSLLFAFLLRLLRLAKNSC
jgi:hypothetical protein